MTQHENNKIGEILEDYVLYFLCSTKRKHFKNYEKHFLFCLKSSVRSQYIQFCVFFPFLSIVSRTKESDETGIIMTS